MSRWALLILSIGTGVFFACGSTETTRPAIDESLNAGLASSETPAGEETAGGEVAATERTATEKTVSVPDGTMTKTEILRKYEKRMRLLLGEAVRRVEEIRNHFKDLADAMNVPLRIEAVEHELSDYYRLQEEAYEAEVDRVAERLGVELCRILEVVKPKVWDSAFELVGTEDIGISYGSRTGTQEVDEIAHATLELIQFRSGLTELEDAAKRYKFKRILMHRLYKHDIDEQGRFSIFTSDPMRHHFRKGEDAVAVTVIYQRRGLDPSIPLEFRQLVRNRIERGGTTEFDSKFHWDKTLQPQAGVLLLEDRDDSSIVVAKVFYPRINMDSPNFDRFRDYTAVRDYKTAVINAKTGEVIDCVSWQYQWLISHFGMIAVEKGVHPTPDEEARLMKAFLEGIELTASR